MKKFFWVAMIIVLSVLLFACSERESVPEIKDVVVRFETDGTEIGSVKNKTIETMPISEKEGYILDGWYEDASLTKRITFPYRAAESCNLYVKWIDKTTGNSELKFIEKEDGTLIVDSCNTYCSTVWIPDEYNGKKIVSLSSGFLEKKQYVALIHIGKYVSEIKENFSRCLALKEFEVDETNVDFISKNGVLFSADGTVLVDYPTAKEDESFTFPDETTTVGNNAFAFNSFLKILNINSGLNAEYTSFKRMESLESINVAEGNTSFLSKEGVLYSSDGSVLLLFPQKYAQTSFSVAPGTVEIKDGSFSGSTIKKLFLNKELTKFTAPDEVPYLVEYTVEEGNAYFVSRDGVLFTDEGATLYLFPQGKTGSYTVPQGTMTVGDFSFGGCILTELIIPASVTRIGNYAFTDAKNLATVTFMPNSALETIEESAFSRCGELMRLTLTSRVPPKTGDSLFDYCSSNLNIVVPAYTEELYRAVWSFCAFNIHGTGESVTLYEVNFDSNGGTEVASVRNAYILTEPVTSRETGNENEYYIFLGWYNNPEGTGEKITFPYAITGDVTLYAAWDIGFYERSLNSGS